MLGRIVVLVLWHELDGSYLYLQYINLREIFGRLGIDFELHYIYGGYGGFELGSRLGGVVPSGVESHVGLDFGGSILGGRVVDYGGLRNAVLEYIEGRGILVGGELVLFLDADEWLQVGSVGGMLWERIFRGRDLCGWLLEIRSIEERFGDLAEYGGRGLRMWRHVCGLRYVGLVHESISGSILGLGGVIEDTDLLMVVHNGNWSHTRSKSQAVGYLELLSGLSGGMSDYYRGSCYGVLGMWDKQDECWRRAWHSGELSGNLGKMLGERYG